MNLVVTGAARALGSTGGTWRVGMGGLLGGSIGGTGRVGMGGRVGVRGRVGGGRLAATVTSTAGGGPVPAGITPLDTPLAVMTLGAIGTAPMGVTPLVVLSPKGRDLVLPQIADTRISSPISL